MNMAEPRILAIDLRAQLFGFAVLEGPRTLLDWGRKPFRNHGARNDLMVVCRKITKLLGFFAPSIIVLKHTRGRNDREPVRSKSIVEAIRREAKSRSIELVLLKRKDIHIAFRQSSGISKYEIAGLVAEIFPELAWKLPPNRKNWQPEHHNMPIFDAISLGVAYLLGRSGN
jgi:hypothetical protein